MFEGRGIDVETCYTRGALGDGAGGGEGGGVWGEG